MPEDMTKLTRLLILEVTSHCNMHCTFCPSDDLVRKKGHVSDEQAIQLFTWPTNLPREFRSCSTCLANPS